MEHDVIIVLCHLVDTTGKEPVMDVREPAGYDKQMEKGGKGWKIDGAWWRDRIDRMGRMGRTNKKRDV